MSEQSELLELDVGTLDIDSAVRDVVSGTVSEECDR